MVGWDFSYFPVFPTRVFAFVCAPVPIFLCGREETLAHSSSLAKVEWKILHKVEEPQMKKTRDRELGRGRPGRIEGWKKGQLGTGTWKGKTLTGKSK